MSLSQHQVMQFASNIQLGLQQEDSKLGMAVTSGSYVGKKASVVDIVDPLEMQEMTGRGEPIVHQEANVDRRWVSPKEYDLAQLIYETDKIRMLTDPTSIYTQNALTSARRKKDRLIIKSFFADAKTGEEGTDTTAFDAANMTVAVNHGAASNVGMTVKKIRQGKLILLNKEVDEDKEEFFLGLTPTQRDNLFAEAQVLSKEYHNMAPVIESGKLMGLFGVRFIISTLFETDTNNYRRNPMWVKSGMHWGNWGQEMHSSLDKRTDLKGHPMQAYVQLVGGATRVMEQKVVEIKSAE